jgi:hypothetical protein
MRTGAAAFLCAVFALSVRAGTFTDSLFSAVADSAHCSRGQGIGLAIQAFDTLHLIYCSPASESPDTISMKTPDVVATRNEHFRFFWSTFQTTKINNIYGMEIAVRDSNTIDSTIPSPVSNFNLGAPSYLHADAIDQSMFISVIDSGDLKKIAISPQNVVSVNKNIDSGNVGLLNASQCRYTSADMLTAFEVSNKTIIVRKVPIANDFPPPRNSKDTAARTGSTCYSPSIAADGEGNILVLWANKGSSASAKFISYSFWNSTSGIWTKVDSADAIADSDSLNCYDYAQVVSYGLGKFVSVNRDDAGIMLRIFKKNTSAGGDTLTMDTVRVVARSECHFPALAVNGHYLAVVWMEKSPQNAFHLTGIRYGIHSEEISRDSLKNLADIQIGNPVIYAVVNCAMDSSGNIGLAWWKKGYSAQRGVLASRDIYNREGFWASGDFSIQPQLTDSIRFDSGAVSASQRPRDSWIKGFVYARVNSDNVLDSFPIDSLSHRSLETKGLYGSFHYKIYLKASSDLLKAPVVERIFLKWNTKPRFVPLKTVRVGSTRIDTLHFGDTVVCRSRIDAVSCEVGMSDADVSDELTGEARLLTKVIPGSFPASSGRSAWFSLDTIYRSDTVAACRFSGRDSRNWSCQDSVLYIKTRNIPPSLRVRAVHSGNRRDTLDIASLSRIAIQQSDTVDFLYAMTDSNDPGIPSRVFFNGAFIQSTEEGKDSLFRFICSAGRPQGDTIAFIAADPEDTAIVRAFCGVNHFPAIDSIVVAGGSVRDGDTVRVTPGSGVSVAIHASDADVGYGDTLQFAVSRGGRDTTMHAPLFTYIPARFDTVVKITVFDLFGKPDSRRFFIKFPWYATDSAENPALFAAKKNLLAVSQIAGGSGRDTVAIAFRNAGNDTLSLLSIRFSGKDRKWMKLLASSGPIDAPDNAGIFPLRCPPDSSVRVDALFMSDSLAGDGLLYDTIIVALNDRLGFDTLPVRLEHNDLPYIVAWAVKFTSDKPYWLAKKKNSGTGETRRFQFPPYAKLAVSFSEPMDSAAAAGGIRMYSVFDSLSRNGPAAVPLVFSWTPDRKTVELSPRYTRSSPFFRFQPMPGFFIPTDSIRFVVESSLTDTAKTPSGPNRLDVHLLGKRDAPSDTTFSLRIDSVTFTVAAVYPPDGAAGIPPGTPIVVRFSSPPLPVTLDTSRTGNRMLSVRSAYKSAAEASFSRIIAASDSVVFVPSKAFFYGDTVRCRYRARWARDALGYAADNDRDGIPLSMFDTSASQDDKQWSFVIRKIGLSSVFPENGAINAASLTPIRVTFSDTVAAFAIDTSPRGNRTLVMTSRCSGGAGIDFDSVRLRGTSATFYPSRPLFYRDDVQCSYFGLSTLDTGRFAFDAPHGEPLLVRDSLRWSFSIKPIVLSSVTPESLSASSPIHPEIVLRFSDQVYEGTFDPDTSCGNRSFRLTSTYTADSALPFRSLALSADRRQVTIRPSKTFFGGDSLHCVFAGFKSDFAYGASDNLPGTGLTSGGYAWYFFIRNQEFYTFPNPYKPGTDPRHCSTSGPCGIWFKNLHALKKGITEVAVKIFTMNAHPIYSSKAAGLRIRFEAGNPQLKPEWKWDTRNQRGELAASGLYLYAVYDPRDNIVMKGKLMIVR